MVRIILLVFLLLPITARAQLSTLGKEFWMGFMDIVPNQPPVQKLYMSSPTGAAVTVSIPGLGWTQNYNLPPNIIVQATLPSSVEVDGEAGQNEVITNKGVKITSNNDISVFATNESNARTEASAVLPLVTLGGNTEYYVAAYQGVRNATSGGATPGTNVGARSELLIVATQDNTSIQITPSCPTRGGKAANTPFTITLNQGQTYLLQAQTPSSTNISDYKPFDLTGTRIVGVGSCKPFAVFAGANATITSPNCMAWEHIYEQQFPLTTWGQEYLVTPFASASQGYIFRVLASQDNTSITVTGLGTFTLNAGQFQEYNITSAVTQCITANKPIAVAQYMKGQNCSGVPPVGGANGSVSDPAMIMLNPSNQRVKKVTFNTVSSSGMTPPNPALYYINVIMKTNSTSKLKQNGVQISSSSFVPFTACNTYSYAILPVSAGAYTLESDSTFIAYHYGYGSFEGYAYSVGASFENLQRNFTVSPSQLVCVGTTVNFTGFGTGITSYSWDLGAGGGTATGPNASRTFTTPGTYEVKMTVTFNEGCGNDVISKFIEVLPYPVVNLGADRTICKNTTTILNAGSHAENPSYLWSTGAQTSAITVSEPGSYWVKVTNRAGCSDTDTLIVSQFPVTPVNITNMNAEYCLNSPTFTLTGTPAGGNFRVNGTAATQFNPTALGVGTHRLIYTYTDGNTCLNSDTLDVVVNPLPTPQITGLAAEYCLDDAPIELQGTPTGGAFTIDGQAVTVFNPSVWGANTKTVVYTYADAKGCVNTISQSVIINPLPVLQFVSLADNYCVDAATITLQATPAGGTFRLNDIAATAFNPSALGVGQHTVRYDYQDAKGCQQFITQNIQVNPLPTPKINPIRPIYCRNNAPVPLSAAPSGGTFNILGDNTPITSLQPSLLNVGQYKLIYTYTDANTCLNRDTLIFSIENPPIVQILGLQALYCRNAAPVDLLATPDTGGTGVFTIDGNPTPVTQIIPSTLSVGSHTLTYTFTDARTECVSSITQNFEISSLPAVALVSVGVADSYCLDTPAFSLATFGSPLGGRFFINGIETSLFNAQSIGVGEHLVQYFYTDVNNCTNLATKTITILPLPETKLVNLKLNYCVQNEAFVMTATPPGGTFRINGTINNGTLNPAALGVGKHTIRYTEPNGCVIAEKEIEIFPPLPPFSRTGLRLCSGSGKTLLLDAGAGTSYQWSTGASTREVLFEQSGTYTVNVTDSLGCQTLSTIVIREDCSPLVKLPNAFSPNGDGVNDVLEVLGEDFGALNLTVYNRWGEIIFVSRDRNQPWDGTENGRPAPAGVYVVEVRFEELPLRTPRKLIERVTLIR